MATLAVSAQSDRDYVRMGNRAMHKGNIDKAAVNYEKALGKNKDNPQALYNFGVAKLKQLGEFADKPGANDSVMSTLRHDADSLFRLAADKEPSKIRRAMNYHNVGVIYQKLAGEQGIDNKQKMNLLETALTAYRQSLKNNPKDDKTRYNYALCKWQLDKLKDQGQGGQDQDKDQNGQDNKQEENQQDQQDQQNQQQPPQQQNIDQQNREAMLENLRREEQRTMQQQKQKQQNQNYNNSLQKNW